ncbi:MAG: DNA polymerase I [Selenomonadaceae bacterium]|nr:DNA polymerase I [Selenomonadaceae bacterium]
MQRFIIIDGNSIFYRAFYAMPPLTAPTGEPTGAVTGFANIILKILREYPADYAAVALDVSRKTFRTEMFSDYKATRDHMPDELAAQLGLMKEFVSALGIKILTAPNYEADDIIGTLATQAENFEVDIVTGDRDAFQLITPTTRVLFNKNQNKKQTIVVYDEEKFFAEFNFPPKNLTDYKGLSGDSSDNIPGVKGIGPKTATKLLNEYGTLENILANADKISQKNLRESLQTSAEIATLSKQLAQIKCDVPDITFDAEKFKITPNFALIDKFCDRYAMKVVKKKVHEIFDTLDNLFAESTINYLRVEKICAEVDVEKIFAAASLSICGGTVKVWDGEIFSVDKALLAKIFNEFSGKIYVNGLKEILKEIEFSVTPNVFDIEVAAYLVYPEMDDYTCEKLLPLEFDGLQMPDDSPAAQVTAIEKLGKLYEEKLVTLDMKKLYDEIELPLTDVLAKMENRGVFVDTKSLDEKSAEMELRIAESEKTIYALAGTDFNINSPKQLAEILFEKLNLPQFTQTKKKTKSGVSTNAEVLENLRGVHPIIEEILNYRLLAKLKSTYLDGLQTLINPDTHRVHTHFNQTVTATGRLSSSDPNLQNIPIRTEEGRKIRALFEPGEGYDFLLSADYSQIELRLLAHMSDDENLINAFLSGEDIHARTAAEVFGVNIADVTPDLRRKAKAVNFGIVYGISDYGLSRDLRTTRKEAGSYIQLYFERYPKVKNFLDATIEQARNLGYVTTMSGRRRQLPNIKNANFHLRGLAERMAMNTPIQGTAADIIKIAMINAEKNLAHLKSRLILQVHDELVIETVAAELEDVTKIVRDAMENVAALKVPLLVDVHHGKNWAEAK